MSIIEVQNLTFAYADTPILKDLSFQTEQGSFLAIAGPNGAGKTTLLNLLCGFLKPKKGSITIDSKKLKSYTTHTLAQKIAVVRQEFVPAFAFSVAQTVSMARTIYYDSAGFETQTDKKLITDALNATDTLRFADRLLYQLSGGERQRVFIARALAQDTPILLLDEPTSFLDLRHQVQIYDLLKKMQLEKQKTIVAITHDINLAAQYCDNVLLLGPEFEYYKGPPAQTLSPEQIEKVFHVTGFTGQIQSENFFLPLGNLAKDKQKGR